MTGAPSNRDCCWLEDDKKTPHHTQGGMPTLFRTLPTKQRFSSSLHAANLFAHLMAARRLRFPDLVFRANLSLTSFYRASPSNCLIRRRMKCRRSYWLISNVRTNGAGSRVQRSQSRRPTLSLLLSKTSSHSSLVTLGTAVRTQDLGTNPQMATLPPPRWVLKPQSNPTQEESKL